MKQKPKKAKKTPNYATLHNRHVNLYKKTAMFLLYIGVLALFAVIIGAVQLGSDQLASDVFPYPWPRSGFALAPTIVIYLTNIILQGGNFGLSVFFIILIGLGFGALFATLGMFAARGYLVPLIIGTVLYATDFGFTFMVNNYIYSEYSASLSFTNIMFSTVIHILVILVLGVAIFEHFHVVNIEKRFMKEGKTIINGIEREDVING